MSKNEAFSKVVEKDWIRGFKNLFKVEFLGWWKGKTFIGMTLLWVGVIDGICALTLIGDPELDIVAALFFYAIFSSLFPPIAVILILQDSIVGEKRSGTASWILSKPVSRKAFILSKWSANALNIFLSMVLIPGVLAYFIITGLTGIVISFPLFFLGILLVMLNQLFYVSLTLMLGAFKDKPATVAAIPMIFNFAQQFLASIPYVVYFLPQAIYLTPSGNSIIISLSIGEPVFSWIPVIFTAVCVILFPILGMRRFEKEEF